MNQLAKIGLIVGGVAGLGALVLISTRASASTVAPSTASGRCTRTDFGGMRFVEVMSGGAAPSDDVPVHVLLHGLGNKPEQYVKHANAFTIPARHIILQGPAKVGSGWGWTVARCKDKDQAKLAEQMTWTANKVELAMDQISECFEREVVLSGLSNGGSMAYAIAARDLIVVKAVVAAAGCLPASLREPMTNTVGIHGTKDTTVPFAGTAEWAQGAGVDWYPINAGHVGDSMIALWREKVTEALQ